MCTELAPISTLSFGPPAPDAFEILVAGRPEPELLARRGLEALVVPFAGLPAITAERLEEYAALPVYNLHHNAAPTAELALALLLAASKRLTPIERRFRAGDWSDRGRGDQALRLEGRRALVLGYGAVGRRVARACAGLGMQVSAIARRARHEDRRVQGPEALADLLPQTDALLLCLPATPRTTGLIGAAELAALPPQAILVNVARGPIVDERALYAALREGHLFGAGLDVWWRYPESRERSGEMLLPSELPFHELENVVLSPHRAGHVQDNEERRSRDLASLLRSLCAGEEPESRVDLSEGY